jgi:hypothetical protein
MFLLLLVGVAACASGGGGGGSGRVVTQDFGAVAGCELLGEAAGWAPFIADGVGVEEARSAATESAIRQAAALGADTILITSSDVVEGGYRVIAQGYVCSD